MPGKGDVQIMYRGVEVVVQVTAIAPLGLLHMVMPKQLLIGHACVAPGPLSYMAACDYQGAQALKASMVWKSTLTSRVLESSANA